jgi:hypothetical protein
MNNNNAPIKIAEYYRRCVPNPPSTVRGTFLKQVGEIRMSPNRPWLPFTAQQTCSGIETEFVWQAKFKMAPLVTGLVIDRYKKGQGLLDAKIWGIIPVAHARGPEIDQGEAQRYLSEIVWCPMALLHNPDINYREHSKDVVRVWVINEQTYVDLIFNSDGDIVGTKTTTRSRGDKIQPWVGRFTDYKQFEGIRAPSRAEVWWETPEGPFVYWRGEVTSLQWLEL